MNSQQNSSVKSEKWAPDLQEYQGMLALTQKGIDVTTGKNAQRGKSRMKTVAKRAADNKIVVSQGD